ncbi:MAG: aminoacyl-tRNA hydrolase [Holosporales bacterium]|nr:aminoacyl-tRNA hydrolase [Holosporales bacterium]
MTLVVGLGNPGARYERTRHNVGFKAVDALAELFDATAWKTNCNAQVAECFDERWVRIVLIKPQTLMNNSGIAVAQFFKKFNVNANRIIVFRDDLDTEVGRFLIKFNVSAGGHNGVKSIVQHLGSNGFWQVKIGIDRPDDRAFVPNYVLADIPRDQTQLVIDAINEAIVELVRSVLPQLEVTTLRTAPEPASHRQTNSPPD